MIWKTWRRRWFTEPAYRRAQAALPPLSATEQKAIEAGDVWWDAELFSGRPDWEQHLSVPEARLSADEQAFLDGPVAELCGMLDDWDITWRRHDLPPEVWGFLKQHGFFGMIIPVSHGGLGFSAMAHSEVVRRISARSITAAVTVMVPNSLGPGELLMQFGTEEQRGHWLPRLARGEEIPCFGLTSLEAGSDAAAMTDTGIVCRQLVDGVETLGIRLNWSKRYITLAPVATVLGLAFKLLDPDGLIGDEPEVGISVALVPTDLPGVTIGRRHLPAMQAFLNGPTQGQDVFVPLDALIGGVQRAGEGWAMLMSALAAGRGISLPSLSAAACTFAAHTAGAYARLRRQFGLPVGRFQGVQERLARLAGHAYLVEAARRHTCAGLDTGRKPSVISAIMKLHATERMRISVDDAMDIHAGKGVMEGPSNYLGNLYRAVPVAITVEGANILTRSLIVFGQGAIRAHPYLMKEMEALGHSSRTAGFEAFDELAGKHAMHVLKVAGRALGLAWTAGSLSRVPSRSGRAAPHYRRLNRYSAAFALVAEAAIFSLGPALKREEMISGRLGDILAELYLLSAALKRWHDEGRREDDLPLLAWCMHEGCARIERRLVAVLDNLPSAALAGALRFMVLPPWGRARRASDALAIECAKILLEPSVARERLLGPLAGGPCNAALADLNRAFQMSAGAEATEEAERLVRAVLQVDDFDPEALGRQEVSPDASRAE